MKRLFTGYRRHFTFVAVGVVCFLVQLGLLAALTASGVYEPVANAIGFLASAQLNFVLSSAFTWGDRADRTDRTMSRLAGYNATALLSLAVNSLAFTLAYHLTGTVIAAALGVLSGMGCTYLICDLVIFRRRRIPTTEGAAS